MSFSGMSVTAGPARRGREGRCPKPFGMMKIFLRNGIAALVTPHAMPAG